MADADGSPLGQRRLAARRDHPRAALAGARRAGRDGLVHRPALLGQVDRRRRRREAKLLAEGHPAYVLDGDNLRHGLNGDLGFSPADRAENVRRTAEVAALMADAGVTALASLVSPFRADRAAARAAHDAAGCASWRCGSPRRWRSASGATRRASTRRPAPGRSPTSRASASPTRRRSRRTSRCRRRAARGRRRARHRRPARASASAARSA